LSEFGPASTLGFLSNKKFALWIITIITQLCEFYGALKSFPTPLSFEFKFHFKFIAHALLSTAVNQVGL
jgi:hypothetical protein